MYEIEIRNNKTNEERFLFGYSIKQAMEKKGLSLTEWTVLSVEYID